MAIISDIFVDSKLWAQDKGVLSLGALEAIWGSQNNIFKMQEKLSTLAYESLILFSRNFQN